MPQLIKDFKRSASKCKKSGPRLPITPQILLNLKQQWEALDPHRDAVMFWAAACLCFSGFSVLRRGSGSMSDWV